MYVKPLFFKLTKHKDNIAFTKIKEEKNPLIFDTIENQILELVMCQNPQFEKSEIIEKKLVEKEISKAHCSLHEFGTWVYYPWKNTLVHTLDEEDFIEVRTNRNKYKITQEEQELLRTKKVGIVGLSVGRAIATTLAIERICGEIRLADFDELELSNLNRINAPLSQLGVNKTESAAHEILELDPYLKIKIFKDGLTKENMDSFFMDGGKIDILVEECDSLDIKILARYKARDLKVPVIMETNDGCHIDVERFDLEPNRKILHGKFTDAELNSLINKTEILEIKSFVSRLFSPFSMSNKMSHSLDEINRSIVSYPQVYSEVLYGSAILVELTKEISSKRSSRSFNKSYKSTM